MSTDSREMSDRELYEQENLGHEFDEKYGRPLNPREYMQFLKRREQRASMMSGNVFNGSTKFVNAMLSINAALLTAAIIATVTFSVSMNGRMSALEAKMEMIVTGHVK